MHSIAETAYNQLIPAAGVGSVGMGWTAGAPRDGRRYD
jgi:hypothetical protein